MDKKLIESIMNEVFFSRDAADYLGISSQRLNQLVHSHQLKPIKSSKNGMLFLKSDLDERIQAMKSMYPSSQENNHEDCLDVQSEFMKEVMNYFTIQQFFNYNDKKTTQFINEIHTFYNINIKKDMSSLASELSPVLKKEYNEIMEKYDFVEKSFRLLRNTDKIVSIESSEYPSLLKQTENAPRYLFLRGNSELLNRKTVSIVGSRMASKPSIEKTSVLASSLAQLDIVIAAGLAKGIDTAAHIATIRAGGNTIAVIGTPLNKIYPKENKELQETIEKCGLIVSQFPPCNPVNRWNFPTRNGVMSGISIATVIMEAGETSGALKQADFAIKQKRLVLIPQSAYNDDRLKWPRKYINERGAHKFSKLQEVLDLFYQYNIVQNKQDSENYKKKEIMNYVQMDNRSENNNH